MSSPALTSEPAEAVTISLSPEQYRLLQRLASMQGIPPEEAISQAIGIAQIVVDADLTQGDRVLIQKGDSLQELTLS